MLGVLVLLLTGAILYWWNTYRYDSELFNEKLSEAQLALDSSEYSRALSAYVDATDIAPNQPDGYIGIVSVLSKKGRYDEAKSVISKVSARLSSKERAQLWGIMADQYASDALYSEGYESADKAFDEDSSQENAFRAMNFAILSANLDKVPDYLSKVEESEAEEAAKLVQIWNKYQEAEELKEEELYEVVQAAREFINIGYQALAASLLNKNDQFMENYWEGKYFLGRANFDLGMYGEAKAKFEEAISLGSDDYTLYLYTARANFRLGETNSAYNMYERAVQFASDEEVAPVVEEYATVLIDQNQYSAATQLIDQFADQDWSVLLYMQLYATTREWDKFDGVKENFDLLSQPSDSDQLRYYGMITDYYLEVDDLNSAKSSAERIELIDGGLPTYSLYKGKISLAENDKDAARTYLYRAVDSDLEGRVTEEALLLLGEV